MSRSRQVRRPDGWDKIEPTVAQFAAQIREVEQADSKGKRRDEALWPIFQLHHAQSRYIYDQLTSRAISRELYDHCVQHGIADANLIAKWKKTGYERLCCLRCIQTKDTNYQSVCVCRVPKREMQDRPIQCAHCGCTGCASEDG